MNIGLIGYLEIAMLVVGVIFLITGKANLGKNARVEGPRARIVGLILVAPLVLAFVFGFLIGFLIGLGILPNDAGFLIVIIEPVLVLGGLIWAFLYARKNTALPAAPPTGGPINPA